MPPGIGYGPKAKKRAAKSASKQLNKKRNVATSKQFGKTVQKSQGKEGRTIGYATVTKTKLPKSGKVRTGTGSKQHKRSVRISRKR